MVSLSGFGNARVMLALQNEFGSVPFSSIFWEKLRRISTTHFDVGIFSLLQCVGLTQLVCGFSKAIDPCVAAH